jgi:hypothetical protein
VLLMSFCVTSTPVLMMSFCVSTARKLV